MAPIPPSQAPSGQNMHSPPNYRFPDELKWERGLDFARGLPVVVVVEAEPYLPEWRRRTKAGRAEILIREHLRLVRSLARLARLATFGRAVRTGHRDREQPNGPGRRRLPDPERTQYETLTPPSRVEGATSTVSGLPRGCPSR